MTTEKPSTPKKTVAVKKPAIKKTVAPAKTATKPATKRAAKPAAAKVAVKKAKKEHKVKVVRDSFTMPQSEYQKIAKLKEIGLAAGLHVKKSEVLRAGLKMLNDLSPAQLKRALTGLDKIKTGRPKTAK